MTAFMWLFAILASFVESPAPAPKTVTRVVSIAPTLSEIVCALDACPTLVGVTRFDDYPAALKGVAKIGGFVDPSLEAIVKLKPDLIVLTKNGQNQSFVRALDQQKLAWIAFTDETLGDYPAIVTKLGALLGRPTQAAALERQFDAELGALSAMPRLSQRALVVYGHAPLVAAGPGSFAEEMLARCGMKNAYSGSARYPTLDFETVVRLRPEIVIDVDMDGGGKSTPQYWNPVRPMLKSAFVFAPDPALMRLGPRLPGAMLALRKQIDQATLR
jgi:iron complex transport system substrate-binding protein